MLKDCINHLWLLQLSRGGIEYVAVILCRDCFRGRLLHSFWHCSQMHDLRRQDAQQGETGNRCYFTGEQTKFTTFATSILLILRSVSVGTMAITLMA